MGGERAERTAEEEWRYSLRVTYRGDRLMSWECLKQTVVSRATSLAVLSTAPATSAALETSDAPPTSRQSVKTYREQSERLTQGVIVDVLGDARAMSCWAVSFAATGTVISVDGAATEMARSISFPTA